MRFEEVGGDLPSSELLNEALGQQSGRRVKCELVVGLPLVSIPGLFC